MSPFKSNAQRRWMYAEHPEMAKRWESETPKGRLPERVKESGKKSFRQRAGKTRWTKGTE